MVTMLEGMGTHIAKSSRVVAVRFRTIHIVGGHSQRRVSGLNRVPAISLSHMASKGTQRPAGDRKDPVGQFGFVLFQETQTPSAVMKNPTGQGGFVSFPKFGGICLQIPSGVMKNPTGQGGFVSFPKFGGICLQIPSGVMKNPTGQGIIVSLRKKPAVGEGVGGEVTRIQPPVDVGIVPSGQT